jgi:hypothetical protein
MSDSINYIFNLDSFLWMEQAETNLIKIATGDTLSLGPHIRLIQQCMEREILDTCLKNSA